MTSRAPLSAKVEDRKNEIGFHIPVNQKDFGGFLAGLLKTPRRISCSFFREFLVDVSRIENIHSLLDQRLKEQHRVAMIAFSATVFYSKGMSISLGSFEEFTSYSEITSDRAIALLIEWTFLVELPDVDLPQKQVVRTRFVVETATSLVEDSFRFRSFRFSDVYQSSEAYSIYEIEHTHVSLGNDLSNLLTSEFERDTDVSFARRIIGSTSFISMMIASLTGIILSSAFFFATKVLAENYFAEIEIDDIVTSGKLTSSLFFAGLAGPVLAVPSFVIAKLVVDKLTEKRPSFIVLSEKARLASSKRIDAFERRAIIKLWIGGVALLTATLSGAFAAKLLELF